MPQSPRNTEINDETTLEDLLLCIKAAETKGDPITIRTGAKAKVELMRREQQNQKEAQQLQEAQNTRLIEAQKNLMVQQLSVAEKQSNSAKHAAWAAWASALAAFVLVILTTFQVFGELK